MKFSKEDRKDLLGRIQADVDLFRKQSLMDYSLLLAITKDERKSIKGKIDDDYINSLKEKYKGNKNIFVSPMGYIYNIGIIDYLQEFNFMKKLENRFKGFSLGENEIRQISAIDPEPYAVRYMSFIKRKVLYIND